MITQKSHTCKWTRDTAESVLEHEKGQRAQREENLRAILPRVLISSIDTQHRMIPPVPSSQYRSLLSSKDLGRPEMGECTDVSPYPVSLCDHASRITGHPSVMFARSRGAGCVDGCAGLARDTCCAFCFAEWSVCFDVLSCLVLPCLDSVGRRLLARVILFCVVLRQEFLFVIRSCHCNLLVCLSSVWRQ